MDQSPVIVVPKSTNSKLGTVAATYSSQASCPSTCPFKNSGCYAETGLTGIHTRRLNKSLCNDPVEIANRMAEGIDKLSGELDMRLNVVGDCPTNESASIVAKSAEKYMSKHGKSVYGYTHAHNVNRESWGTVSVLRSCESKSQLQQNHDDGFANALIVAEFESDKPYDLGDGFVGIPCRNQVNKDIQCVNCRLCMKDRVLHKSKRVILFTPHGVCKNKVKATVNAAN